MLGGGAEKKQRNIRIYHFHHPNFLAFFLTVWRWFAHIVQDIALFVFFLDDSFIVRRGSLTKKHATQASPEGIHMQLTNIMHCMHIYMVSSTLHILMCVVALESRASAESKYSLPTSRISSAPNCYSLVGFFSKNNFSTTALVLKYYIVYLLHIIFSCFIIFYFNITVLFIMF